MLLDPRERLLVVSRYQAELRREAAENRMCRVSARPVDGYTVSGLQLKIGRLLIVVGKTIPRPAPGLPRTTGSGSTFS